MRLITLFGLMFVAVIILAVAFFFVYDQTKDSYRRAGFNSGLVQANFDLVQKIRAHGAVVSCESLDKDIELISFVKVKADEIYIVKRPDGILFCEPR